MIRHSETMRATSRLLGSHPIVCLLAALAAVVVVAVLGPLKVVYAADTTVEGESFTTKPAAGTYDIITGARYSGGAALRFKADVTASHPVNCSAPCDVVLMASGGQTGGQPTFSVNGLPAQALKSTTTTAYTFHLPDGASTISVTAGGTGAGHNAILDVAEVSGGTDPGGDRDGDTIPDASDNCPDVYNPGQRDDDKDGIGNKCDGGSTTPQCSDTLDNDNDGKIDYPADLGCSSSTDNDETNPTGGAMVKLVGAGDIAGSNASATAKLVKDRLDANPTALAFTAGDNAYPDGSASDFSQKYEPTWGVFKNKTRPSPGNHDYNTSNASGYKNYFSGVPGVSVNPTYYAYTLGAWRIYALDSSAPGVMAVDSPQYTFLKQDMTNNTALCELAYWHHPVFSSGQHGNSATARPIFELFDALGGDLVLNGHDHNYEAFAESASGVRQIVVGTGGTGLRGEGFVQPGSEKRIFNTHGIVDITLEPTGYSGQFVPVPGKTSTHSFSGTCGT